MKRIIFAASIALCSLAFGQTSSSVATVTSRAPIAIQGVEVPGVGGTAWPVMTGDVIQTKSAPAEVRLKDGTRILVPASSRYVVGTAQLKSNLIAPAPTVTRQGSYTALAAASGSASMQYRSSLAQGVITVMDGGAMVMPTSTIQSFVAAANINPKSVTGDTAGTFSLAGLLATYGVNSPIVGAIDQALSTSGAVIKKDSNGNFYVTGVQASVGGGAPQPITIVITGSQISLLPGTVAPNTPNPPAPIVTFTPPPPGSGTTPGCKGSGLKPADVSGSIITVPTTGTC